MIMFPKKFNHKYKEAYCLMKYGCKKLSVVGAPLIIEETIWNSRDGITPYIIHDQFGNEMIHMKWHEDIYAPHHVLKEGDRYFADMSRDRAKFLAKHWVDTFGNWPDYSKDETIYLLAKEYYGDGHVPTLLKFGESAVEYLTPYQRGKR